LKLQNVNTGSRLHSHDVKYGSGSGQQSVTAVRNADDNNSYWQVKAKFAGQCKRG
jgi:dolichyl-phosphate-mannose--protein O-mannosyl transferase